MPLGLYAQIYVPVGKIPLLPEARAQGKPQQQQRPKHPLPPSEQQQPRCRRPGCAAREQTEQARYSILPDNWPAKPKL